MNGWELLWYAASDLRHRWLTAALNVAAVGISVVYVLVLGFYAVNTHRYQQRVVEESGPAEKIIATVPNAADAEQWFTRERIGELGRSLGARLAFPCVELNVDVSLDGQRYDWVTLESTAPGDPTAGRARMIWGGPVRGLDGDEVVLGKSLFEKLGGKFTPAGPAPAELTVRLKRTRGGVEEVHRHPLRIVGVLKNQPGDRLYLPAECAAALDRWAAHRRNSLEAERSPTAGLQFPFCYGYVPEAEDERVAGECERLGLTAQRKGGVNVDDRVPPVTLAGDPPDWMPFSEHDPVVEQRPFLTHDPAWEQDRFLEHHFFPNVSRSLAAPRLLRYEIRAGQRSPGPMDDRSIALLRMSQPTFAAVRPYLGFEALVAGQHGTLTAVASDAADPGRYAAGLREGAWIDERDEFEIVVPSQCLAAARVGANLDVVVQRPGVGQAEEQVTLPLRIVGVVERGPAAVPLPLAARVIRWQQGELRYDATTRRFEAASAAAERDGYVRCTLIAGGLRTAPALVERLRQQGYRTVDQLAAHDGLLRLAKVLTLLVGLAVLGCVLNGAITVLISTLMSVRSKTFEIGILRAHGFRDGEVVAIFLLQAVLVGSLALVFAVTVVLVAEPWVRGLVCGAAGIRAGAFVAASPFSPGARWLFGVAAGMAVAFSVAGVTIPAAWACRLSPVQALRRRE